MCQSFFGIESFRNYKFIPAKWDQQNELTKFEIKKSHIVNAGNGVFAKQLIKYTPIPIMHVHGEPMESWKYNALDIKDEIYTGINFNFSSSIGKGVWRGIPHTLATSINSTFKENEANVEIAFNSKSIDVSRKEIDEFNFVNVYVKKNCVIKPQDELLLYYGPNFWKYFKKTKYIYCCICLHSNSVKKNKIVLCDGSNCNLAFHEICYLKHTQKKIDLAMEFFYCLHCDTN